MDRKDSRWQAYFAIRKLREAGRTPVFLSSDRNNWLKAWASAAGASIHQSLHGSELSEPIGTSRPVTVVALAMRDSPAPALAALLRLVRRGTIADSVTTGRSELYVVETPGRDVAAERGGPSREVSAAGSGRP